MKLTHIATLKTVLFYKKIIIKKFLSSIMLNYPCMQYVLSILAFLLHNCFAVICFMRYRKYMNSVFLYLPVPGRASAACLLKCLILP